MKKLRFFLLMMVIVFIASGVPRLLFFYAGKSDALFNISDFLIGSIMPVILFFFDKKQTQRSLIIVSLLWPLAMNFVELLNFWKF